MRSQYNIISMIGFIYRHFIDFDNAYYELYIIYITTKDTKHFTTVPRRFRFPII